MSKDLLQVNVASGGALLTCLSQIELYLAVAVLATALYINIRSIIRSKDESKSPS